MLTPNTKSLREAYGQSLVELGRRTADVVVLEADLGKSTRTVLFQGEFPKRFFEMGIAEQNMTSTAAGFALAGKVPFVNSFAIFATGRAFDQIRNSICVPGLKVRICGSSSGLSDYGDGKTHQSIEDLSIVRALPHMTVLAPADAVEVVKMMEAILDIEGPVYLRINRNDLPTVTPEGESWVPGKVWRLREGKDAAVFANGVMVSKALEAAETLAAEGIEVRVLNVSTIKPIDSEAVLAAARGMKGLVTAEEGNVLGGVGSAVLEALRSASHAPVEMVGVQDSFGLSARSYDEILQKYGLTAAAIVAAVKASLAKAAP